MSGFGVTADNHNKSTKRRTFSREKELKRGLCCARMRRWAERSNNMGPLPLRPFCRGGIVATRGYDFRKGQVAVKIPRGRRAQTRAGRAPKLTPAWQNTEACYYRRVTSFSVGRYQGQISRSAPHTA
jgi:hypothetical protein